MSTLLTISDAARRLSVSAASVRRLIDRGELEVVDLAPAGSTRRTIRIRDSAVVALVARKTVEPARDPRLDEKLREIEWLEQIQGIV